ncbi:MAG: hypothetical protein GY839_01430 [candidate division Zixibacteria bacterium]|nr:hypothetical protein [candidate division Zixibacteria bacterium]
MNYFAVEAYRESRNHPMASYIFAVSQLIMGESHEANSDSDNAQSFYNAAQTAINEITEPREGLHYMHAQYHKMNYDEFITLKPYYGKFPDIGARLKLLHEKATYLSKEGKISTPKDYYELTPYLVLGGRAASVIGLVVTAATLAGIDLDTIDNAIRSIWSDALRIIPGLDVEDVKSITLHGGGPAIELAQMFDFHGGGPA